MVDTARRNFFRAAAGAGALALSGCKGLSQTQWWPKVLASAEGLTVDRGGVVGSGLAAAHTPDLRGRSAEDAALLGHDLTLQATG